MATKKKSTKAVKKLAPRKPKLQVLPPEVYIDNDIILSTLPLTPVVPITIRISSKTVELVVGQRDWSWDRKTKKLIGTGTCLTEPVADEVVEEVQTHPEPEANQ